MLHNERNKKFGNLFIAWLTIWLAGIATLSYAGVFRLLNLQFFAFLVVASTSTLLIVYFKNQNLRKYLSSFSYKHLTILNVWRIPAGAAFLYYGWQNWLPEQFVFNAGYGDLIVGIAALLILPLPETISKYVAFHIFGLLDFIVAVGTGLTLTLLETPLIENVAGFPIVLIPLFGVPITGALHIILLHRLWSEKNAGLVEVKI
jgi:hypothetical protein